MKNHVRTLLVVLGQIFIYTFVPGVLYVSGLGILSVFSVRDLPESVTTLVIDYLTLLVAFLAFRYYSPDVWNVVFNAKIHVKKILQLIPISFLTRVPLVIVVIILYVVFGDTVTNMLDEGVEYQWSVFDGTTYVSTMIGFMSFVIVGPIHEELLYRGVIQRFLRSKYSVRTSIIVSSTVFALAHIHPGLILSSFVLGLFLGYIYHKWDNLWYAIILHMLINLQPFLLQMISK